MEMNDPIREYYRLRGLIEEFNANLMVENYQCAKDKTRRSIWLVFDPLIGHPMKIVEQILKISQEYDLGLISFRVGISHTLIYIREFKGFFKFKFFEKSAPTPSDVERSRIPKRKIASEIKSLYFEHKRRSHYYGSSVVSRPADITRRDI